MKSRNPSERDKISAENVNSLMSNIHGNTETDTTFSGNMGDFTPHAPPMSAGVEQTRLRENVASSATSTPSSANPYSPSEYSSNDNGPHLPEHPLSNNTPEEDKYRTYIPNYKKMYENGAMETNQSSYSDPYQGNANFSSSSSSSKDPLIEKLNYMIHMIEEQKDDKTSRVGEEIMLYLFLGIFVIFIVDSFTRLGKYTR